jgi:hypothetical protein
VPDQSLYHMCNFIFKPVLPCQKDQLRLSLKNLNIDLASAVLCGCPVWQVPRLADVLFGKCCAWRMSCLANAALGGCPVWQVLLLAGVLFGKCRAWRMSCLASTALCGNFLFYYNTKIVNEYKKNCQIQANNNFVAKQI